MKTIHSIQLSTEEYKLVAALICLANETWIMRKEEEGLLPRNPNTDRHMTLFMEYLDSVYSDPNDPYILKRIQDQFSVGRITLIKENENETPQG